MAGCTPVRSQLGLVAAVLATAIASGVSGQSMSPDTCTDCGPYTEDAYLGHASWFCMLRGTTDIPRSTVTCAHAPSVTVGLFFPHISDNCCFESAIACSAGALAYNTQLMPACGTDETETISPSATTSRVCTATTPPPVSPTRPPTDPPTNPAPPTAPPAVGVPTQSPTTMDQANCVKFRDWPLEVLGNHTAAQCHTVTAQDTADSKAYCLSSKYTSDEGTRYYNWNRKYCAPADFPGLREDTFSINSAGDILQIASSGQPCSFDQVCCFLAEAACTVQSQKWNNKSSPNISNGAASEYTSDVCLVYTSPANETDWATCGPKCLAGTHISTFPDPKSQRPGMCVDNGCSAGSDEGVRCCMATSSATSWNSSSAPWLALPTNALAADQCQAAECNPTATNLGQYGQLYSLAFPDAAQPASSADLNWWGHRFAISVSCDGTDGGSGQTVLEKMSATDDLAISIGGAVLVLLIIVGAFYWRTAHKKANLKGEELELHQILLTEAGNIMEQFRRAWLISEDDLTLGRLLGKGNFGSVYSGSWLGRQVAVKVLQDQLLDTQMATDHTTTVTGVSHDFDKEAETMIQLHHPNLVGFFGAGSMEDGSTFLVTEFMARGTLRDLLSQDFRGLLWERKIRFCLDVASGMLFLHSRWPPMIHRDLKADNVLVSEHYQVKIADFGTAARLRSEGGISQRDVLQGSPLWIAPELLKDDSTSDDVTTANDVYSFAMLLYEVASGFLPFQDAEGNFLYDDNFQLYRDVVAGIRPQIPMRCHATLKSLMTKCWESDPTRRPDFKYISEHLVVADLPDLVVGSTSTQGGPPDSYRDVMPLPGAGAGAGAESAL